MNNNIQVLYLYKKLTHLHSKEEKQHLLHTLTKHDKQHLVTIWRRNLKENHHNEEAIMITNIIKQILIEYSAKEHYLEDITIPELDSLASFMKATKNCEASAHIIDILYLQRGVETIPKCKNLFKVLVDNFQHLQNDQIREMVTENLTEMMKQNKELIPLSNKPYYFMEYLLHLINQEEDLGKVVYWFQILKELYLYPESQKYMFYQNDFRILVDILVRNIQNFENEKDLVTYLETYLVLSISPYIIKNHKYYKIEQIILVLNDLNSNDAAIKSYTNEIKCLQLEDHK